MKIPRNLTGDGLVGVVRQKLIERTLIVTLDGNLGEQIERDLLLATELSDLAVGTGLLVAEIVGWERENVKALVLVLLED